MLFCFRCGNMLLVDTPEGAEGMRFYCQTCPYLQPITSKAGKTVNLTRKKVEDVMGGDKAWENVDQCDAACPHCEVGKRAYFFQMQIRSADEPMTTFYKCVECKRMWNSN